MKNLNLIVAMDNRGAIGNRNQLLCHLPNDLKHFKEITSGHTIIMGRKTWESLKIKPLPNRRNIVLTHNRQFHPENCEIFYSKSELMKAVENDEVVFVIGGASVYELFLDCVETMYITRILADFQADTHFPNFDWNSWTLQNEVTLMKDEANRYDIIFQKYGRINQK